MLKLPIITKKGPKPELHCCYDENDNNITKFLREFLGPNMDFFGIDITPSLLDKQAVKIVYENGKTDIFTGSEKIILNDEEIL